MTRVEPPLQGSERKMLVGWLDYHRETLAMKCEGLSSDQLSERAIAPSSLSLAGLLRHLAELERTYFRRTFAGEDVAPLPFEDDPFREGDAAEYAGASDNDGATALANWQEEVRRARDIIDRTESLSDEGTSGLPLRFWLVKTLNEYARHNGHADLLRECIDGTTGE
jgi:uncharacterized damage-inducible protein DinB